MSPIEDGYAPQPSLSGAWRRAVAGVWRLERAFRRTGAADQAVDDSKLRIFLILCLFALAFGFMGAEAARKALFSGLGPGLDQPAPAFARADMTDRDGRLLAVDLPHYGLYVDAREVWDRGETRRGLSPPCRAFPPTDCKRRWPPAAASSWRQG